MKNKQGSYTRGPIARTMIQTAFAMVPGTLAMSGYNLADAYFVGRLGREPLAAMGFTFPVIMLAWCIFHGLAIGVVTTTSQALGGGRKNKAAGLVECGVILSILLSIVIAVCGIICCRWIFEQFGARENTLELVLAYMNIWFAGCVSGTLSGLGNSLLWHGRISHDVVPLNSEIILAKSYQLHTPSLLKWYMPERGYEPDFSLDE